MIYKDFFISGGCRYSRNHSWVAHPLYSSPHGGIFTLIDRCEFYQDYTEQYESSRRAEQEAQSQANKDRWRDQARKFAEGFFGFPQNDDVSEAAQDPEYPYSVFGLKKSASQEDMKKAYRKEVRISHPDKGGTNEVFVRVRQAWEYFCSHMAK